mmetsp:Transcript_136869/g.355250  ORF Transcript_136869/g.355250 Transcript_136869/m.355250 type:complete len:1369 (-) Transcript_136869:35-4141(-)
MRSLSQEEQSAIVVAGPGGGPSPTGSRAMSPQSHAAGAQQQLAMPAAGPAAPQGLGQLANAKRKQASVVEMLEYVKGLDIDPIKESDMLWIAEEAFNAALPPGWSEHQDEEGRVYFHNNATGDSVWRHPMDDLFREIVEYQRNVIRNGGFHQIEDEIAELEENIRRDLADWMELFDEHGEKFFYNRRTDDSRFDDPRMAVYHNLYARIKMVAKMKERLPVLARAPRPEEPTQQELELRRRQQEEEERYLKCLIKIQACARVVLAKRAYRNKLAQATVQKGPQPLRGKLRLRMEKVGQGKTKELMLSMTTPHKRHRAAMKIQARMRGVLARKKFRPLVLHRAFLSKIVTKIQTRSRVWLARRAAVRMRHQRVERAATNIQRVWRGHRDRMYVSTLRGQKSRYIHYMKSVKFIQKRARIMIKRKRFKEKQRLKFLQTTQLVQRQIKMARAREFMHKIKLEQQPVQALFQITEDPDAKGVMPWTWQLWIAPWLDDPSTCWQEDIGQFENIFTSVTPDSYQHVAATKIQALARGASGRRRVAHLRSVANDFIEELETSFWNAEDKRINAAIYIQATRRMYLVWRQGLIAKLKMEHLANCIPKIMFVQAQFLKYTEQAKIMRGMQADEETEAATHIQAMWRGWLARKHYERLSEEALWSMKGWFEYTATGREACQIEVKFVPNPSFDDYRHFVLHGPPALVALDASIEELQDQLKESILHIESILGGPLVPEGGFPPSRMASKAEQDGEEDQVGAAASSRPGSRMSGTRPSESRGSARSRSGSKLDTRDTEAAPRKSSTLQVPDAAQVASSRRSSRQSVAAPAPEESPAPATSSRPSKDARDRSARRPQALGAKAKGKAKSGETPSGSALPTPKAPSVAGESVAKTPSAASRHSEDGMEEEARPSTPAKPGTPLVVGPDSGPLETAIEDASQEAAEERDEDEMSMSEPPLEETQPIKPKKAKPMQAERSHAHSFFTAAAKKSKKYIDAPLPWGHDDVPKPPGIADPSPPGPDPSSAKVQALRSSQSEPTLAKEKPIVRKSYGGTVVGGKFIRSNADTIDDLSEADKQKVLADIEQKKMEQQALIAEKAKFHKSRKQKEEQSKQERFKAQLGEAEAQEEERRKKKVKELKKWLKKKEDEQEKRRARDAEIMAQVMEKEAQKSEAMKKIEADRLEQRERRLRIAERQKVKIEQQLLLSREAARAPPLKEVQPVKDEQPKMAAGKQRVVHRHLHHHVHYHDSDEEAAHSGDHGPAGYKYIATEDERKQMEAATEARIRAQLESGGGPEEYLKSLGPPYGRLPSADDGAQTPPKRRALSHGSLPLAYHDPMGLSRTQQAFTRQPMLPQLPVYQRGLERAMGSYADSGRPKRMQGFAH